MSPPIRDGSGSGIGSIRLGDGSEISEVRTGAGDVLFSAISDSIVDGFEEVQYENKNNTLSDYYSGDLSTFGRDTNSPVAQESYSLKLDNAPTATSFIASTSGLKRYPQTGEKYSVLIQPSNGIPAMAFNAVDSNNLYSAFLRPGDDAMRLERADSGSFTKLNEVTVSISTGQWYDVQREIDSNGNIIITLYDWDTANFQRGSQLETLTATDTNYVGETGVAFGSRASGTTAAFDYARIV